MNNEPVAWMHKPSGTVFNEIIACVEPDDLIPLYTHPAEHDLGIAEAIGFEKGYKAATAKTLTIEEITEVSKEIFKGYKNFYHYQINFARAILKKAQEK